MYYVIVYFNTIKDVFNHSSPLRLNHVTEHYCTEKMFFVSCSDESSVYIPLDAISKIEVFKETDEEE